MIWKTNRLVEEILVSGRSTFAISVLLAAAIGIWSTVFLYSSDQRVSELVVGVWEEDFLATSRILFDTAGGQEDVWPLYREAALAELANRACLRLEFFSDGNVEFTLYDGQVVTHPWKVDPNIATVPPAAVM